MCCDCPTNIHIHYKCESLRITKVLLNWVVMIFYCYVDFKKEQKFEI